MVILCDGMVRSGSTWSFNVALKILRSCDPDRKTFGIYNENPAVLAAAVRPRSSHLVIKSHSVDPSARRLCCTDAVKAIYTWRHPYDAVASCVRMFGSSVEHWIEVVRDALRLWSFHQQTSSACIVSYEAIVTDPVTAIARIASHLDLAIEPEALQHIAAEVSFKNLKRFSDHIDELGAARLIRSNGQVYDRETLLHPHHIRNGGIGYGADSLPEQQLAAIDLMLQEEGFASLCQPRGEKHKPRRVERTVPLLTPLAP
jgi:Sulfotransferase domain